MSCLCRLCIVVFVMAFVAKTYAQPVFEVSFDGDENGKPPQVSVEPDLDGTFTKPAFVKSDDEYGIVVLDPAEDMKGKAVLMSGKSTLDFIALQKSFEENRDFSLEFTLRYDPALTDKSKYGLRVDLYNEDVSHEGYQVSVIFVPNGIRVISGDVDQTIGYSWGEGEVIHARLNLLYAQNLLEISMNDDLKESVPIAPAAPAGVRAFQFRGGSEDSNYVAALAGVKAQAQ